MSKNLPSFISFTGADDKTDIDDLIQLQAQYEDKIEFGILYFPEKQGQPRNPKNEWIEELYERAPHVIKQATAHLCGPLVFQSVLKDEKIRVNWDTKDVPRSIFWYFDRVQLNINARNADFTPHQVWQIYDQLYKKDQELVLQYNEQSKPTIDEWFRVGSSLKPGKFNEDFFHNLQVLYDTSRGRGVYSPHWPVSMTRAERVCTRRYAGGINPDNVLDAVQGVLKARSHDMDVPRDQPWALDLESGCRNKDNEFDISKIDVIMQKVYG